MMSRVLSLIRRLSQRSWRERGLLGLAVVTGVGMWGALRVTSFRRLVRWTGTIPDRPWQVDDRTIEEVVWAVRATSRRLFPDRPCLPQALAARFLLARLGVSTELRIGVAKEEEDALRAHAWLEQDGRMLIGRTRVPMTFQPLTKTSDRS